MHACMFSSKEVHHEYLLKETKAMLYCHLNAKVDLFHSKIRQSTSVMRGCGFLYRLIECEFSENFGVLLMMQAPII